MFSSYFFVVLPHTHSVSWYSQVFSFHARLLFTGLDDFLSQLEQVEQRPSSTVPPSSDTSNTSVNESDMGEPRRRMRSRRTYKMKKA